MALRRRDLRRLYSIHADLALLQLTGRLLVHHIDHMRQQDAKRVLLVRLNDRGHAQDRIKVDCQCLGV